MLGRFFHFLSHLLLQNEGRELYWIRRDRGDGCAEGWTGFRCSTCGRMQFVRRLRDGEQVDVRRMEPVIPAPR